MSVKKNKGNKKVQKILASALAASAFLIPAAYAERSGGVDVDTPISGTYENGSGVDVGGAFSQAVNSTVNDGTTFKNNTATAKGGAIYNEANMTMGSNVSFIGNGALSGGAIYNAAAGHIEIGNNALFKDNTSGYGGNSYGGSDIKNYGYIQVGDGAQFVRSAYLDPWADDVYDTGIYGMTGSTVQIGDNATFKNVVQTINTESGTYIVGDNATFDHNGSVITNFGGNHTIGDNATFKDTQFITLTNKSNNGTITVGDNAYFTGNKTRSDYMSGNGAIANNSAANTTITFGDGLVAEGNIAAGKGVVYNDKATASTIFNGSADFVNNVAQDAVVYNKGIATFNGKTTFVGNKNAESAKIKDIHNTGTLNINSEMDIDGGISGTGTINLGAGSTVNMLSEEVTGTSVLQAATINVADGAKVALDWGDTIDASSAMGDGLRVSALYVDSSKLTDGNSFELFTNASGTLNASSLSALGIYSGSDKYNVSQSGKNLVLAKVAGAGGLAPAIDDNAQETVFSFEGDHNENIDGASLDYGNLNIMGKAGSDNNIGLTGNDGIGVGAGHKVYAENVDFEQANSGNSFDVAAGGEVSFKDSSADKTNNDGDFVMEFTQNKDIDSQISGSGNLNAKVGTGATVNWDTQYGVQQGGTITFEGDGHIKLFDGTNGSGAGVVGDIINKTTGSSLEIDGTEIAGDGATVSGNVTNTLGSHLILTKDTSVAGVITNDGLADIKNGTFTISAGGIVDAAGTGAQGTLNIGDGTNTTTVDASTNSSPIAQNQINILDKGKLSANASKITSPNAIANAGTLELTGGTSATSTVTGANATSGSGKIVIDGFVNQTGALNTTNTASDAIKVNTGKYLKINADNLGAATLNLGILDLTGGTINNNINVDGAITTLEGTVQLSGNTGVASGVDVGGRDLNLNGQTLTLADGNTLQFQYAEGIAGSKITDTNKNSQLNLSAASDLRNVTLEDIGTIKLRSSNFQLDASKVTTENPIELSNNANVTLTGASNTSSFKNAGASYVGNVIIAETMNNTGSFTNENLKINNGVTFTTNANKLGTTNDVDNQGTLVLTGDATTGLLGTGITDSQGTKTGVTQIGTAAGGAIVTTNGHNITQAGVTVLQGVSGNVNELEITAGDTVTAPVTVQQYAYVDNYGGIVGDVSLTTDSSLYLKDTATVTGNVASTGGSVVVRAISSDAALSQISGDLTGSYVITAGSTGTNTATIDKAIAGATAVNVTNNANSVITDTAYTTTTAAISAGNGSTLTLDNTTSGSATVGSTISPIIGNYDLNIVNSNATAGTTVIGAAVTGADDVNVKSGTATFDADVTSNTLTVDAGTTLNVNSGKTASGNLTNSGTVANSGTLSGTIDNATAGSTLTTATSGLTNGADIKNDGTITFNDTGATGTIAQNIVKSTAGNGVVEIAGGTNSVFNLASGKSITNNALKLTSGTFDATNHATSAGAIDFTSASTGLGTGLIANGGTLSVQDGKMGAINLGTVDTTTSGLNVMIDAQFVSGPITAQGITGSSDIITGAVTTAANKINVSDIKITADPVATEFRTQIADAASAGNIGLTAATLTGLSSGAGDVLLTYNNSNGYLTGGHATLKDAIISTIPTKLYAVGDGDLSAAGDLTLGGNSLSVTAENKTIQGGGNKVALANSAQTLSISGGTGTATIQGFSTAIDNAVGGTVNLNNVTMTGNTTADVNNDGTGNLNLTGTNSIDKVTGSGTTNVNSGTTTINTSIAQDTINVGDAVTPADAALVNGGTVNATNLNVNTAGSTYTNGTGKTTTLTGKLTNKGGVANDGTLSTDTIDNQKTISGTGDLTVANGGSNAGTGASITQNNITLNGGTFANDADMTANGLLTNKATLNNSSNVSANTLDNDSVIAGTGNLTVVAGGSSDGAISQATVALTSGNFDNNANITTTGAFTNGAALDNDANISVGGAFTNTNAITTASGTGSISVAGGGSSSGAIAQKNMTLTGTTLFDNNADITLSGVLTNAAPLDNDANISADSLINTAAITSASGSGNLTVANGGSSSAAITQNNISLNGGTFNNTADMTANGLLTNKGTLNNNGAKVKANTLDNDSIIAGTGDLEVTAGGSSDGAISQATVKLTGGNFDNNANITTTGDFTTGANLDNDAAIVVGNQFVNTGVVTTASDTGTLKVANGGSSTGAITQKVVELTGGAFDNDANITTSNNFINGSALDNDAAISVGNQFINTGVVTTTNGTGTITVANGGSSTADVTQKDITFNGGAFDNTAVMTSTGTFTNNNTTITGDNGTLNVNNGSSTGKITQGTIAVAGNFDNDADMEAKTLLNVKAGANLDNDATVTAAKLTNDGVISQTAGTGNLNISGAGSYNSNSITQNNVNVKGGDFTNKTGADLMATTKLTVDAPATMVNQGNVGKSGTPVPTVQNDGTFTNDTTGVVYATLLDNNSTATNKNSIVATTVENDGTYKNDGASSSLLATTINNNAGADFENDGKVGTASDPVITITNNGKSFTNNGTGHIVANTFNNNTDMENKVGGVIDSNVAMTNNGTATNDGQINAKGTFTNNSIVKNSAEKQGELNVVDGTNSGTMTQGDVTVAAGNTGFTNQAGGTINTEKSFVNNGILNNNSIINAINSTHDSLFANNDTYNGIDSTLNADNVANTGTMNLTRSNMIVSYQAGDIAGTINIKGTTPADASKISVEGPNPNIVGNVNVGSATDTATLNFVAGNIKDVASLNLVKGSVLNVNDGGANKASVVINENDNYQGDVKLAGGNVEMRNIYLTTGDTSTTAGAELPYYEQTGGTLALNNSRLTMTDASKISGGNLIVDPSSVFTSLRNGFNVNTLQNGGLVQAVNNGYEHYGIQNHVIGSPTNEQGNYTVDLYARSNLLKSYDSFGDGNTLISAANASRNGTINVSDFVLHGDLLGKDAPIDRVILFQNMFGGSINPGDNINFTSTDKRIFTPIGGYKLSHAGQGNYMLELSEFNPAVFRGQVTKLAQYQNQLAVDDMLFTHSMVLPSFKDEDGGMSKAMMANRYAGAGDMYAPYAYTRKDGGLWFKSYGNFERLNMSHNLDIGNNGYGALIGADFGLKELSHGWKFMPTAYIAYNGAHQYFKYAGAYQNGGQAGFMGTWYKDDILLSALAYGGLYGNHMTVHNYSSEDSLGYFAGAATKAAYNWRVHKDFVIQPNLLAAYNYFGKENWHTDFGQMGMMSGMLHGINIAPGVNFIWEKDTFSAYLTVQYMYNVNQSLGGRAGNVYLPRVSMDRGYLQYGIGVNKRFSDRVSGYLQAVVRNVGRTGIGFQAGLEISLGKDKK